MNEVLKKKVQEVPAGAYMNEEQRKFFRGALEREMTEIRERIEERRTHLATHENEPDETDLATAEENRQLLLKMLSHDRQRLKDISEALKALDAGDYGYCAISGEEIGIERLAINPAALHSFESKQVMEAASKHRIGAF